MRTPANGSSKIKRWAIATLAAAASVAILLIATMAMRGDRVIDHDRVTSKDTPNPESATVSGRVSSRDGELLAGAIVCLHGDTSTKRLLRSCATSDAEGRYSVEVLSGHYTVVASAVAHASKTTSLAIAAGAHLDLILDPQLERTVAGRVRSATGVPIANARVAIYQGSALIASLVADNMGEFSAWTPTGALRVRAEADGFGAAAVHTVTPTLDVLITLFPGNAVSGRVLLEGSLRPVPSVVVTALSRKDGVTNPVKDVAAVTDTDGNFVFSNLAAGTWMLSVADRNVWGQLADPVFVSIGQETKDLDLIVRPASAVIGRLVLQGSGQPCLKGRVQLSPAGPDAGAAASVPVLDAVADGGGMVRFEAVPFGRYRIGPYCDEHRIVEGPDTLEVSDTPLREQQWKFAPGQSLLVQVVDETANPIGNAIVGMHPDDSHSMSRVDVATSNRQASSDAEGRYRFGALRPGRYVVSARYPGINGKATTSATIDIAAATEPAPLTLTLPGSALIQIRARTAAGTASSRMLFFATDENGARFEAVYRGDGRYGIGPVATGHYRIFGYDNKNPKIPLNRGQAVYVSGSQAVELDFMHDEPKGIVEGRVLDGKGLPASGVLVRAVSSTLDETDEFFAGVQTFLLGEQEQMTDAQGRFRIDGLRTEAVFDLHIDHLSGSSVLRSGVRAGEFVEVALPTPTTIVGVVQNDSGGVEEDFDVVVDLEGQGSASRSFKAAHGRFTLDGVNPGRMTITVYSSDGDRSASKELSATSGQTADAGRFELKAGS